MISATPIKLTAFPLALQDLLLVVSLYKLLNLRDLHAVLLPIENKDREVFLLS